MHACGESSKNQSAWMCLLDHAIADCNRGDASTSRAHNSCLGIVIYLIYAIAVV